MDTAAFGWSGSGGGGGGGGGTVTYVGLSMPTEYNVAGTPITNTGTFTVSWNNQLKNTVFAGPVAGTGTPSFRLLDASDIPTLPYVTSVGISMPSQFSVANSPVTSSGTLTVSWQSQSANLVFASPNGSAGVPTFRSLNLNDMPQEVKNAVASANIFNYYNFI